MISHALQTPHVPTPRLSARSAAKFLRMPALDQVQLLREQKFPKNEPQVFRQPYYAPALNGVRSFLSSGEAALVDARAQIQRIRVPSRRLHSLRVLEQFVRSEHAQRHLVPTANRRYYAHMGLLELRLSADLFALEGDSERIIFFNANAAKQDSATARMTLDLAHWVLARNGIDLASGQLEFIDLFDGTLYRHRKSRGKTVDLLQENVRLIESLWPTLEP